MCAKISGVLSHISFLRTDSVAKRNTKTVDYANEKEVGRSSENPSGVKYAVSRYKQVVACSEFPGLPKHLTPKTHNLSNKLATFIVPNSLKNYNNIWIHPRVLKTFEIREIKII